jgi:hypothetical protein
MCNLYSITTNQAAIIALLRVINRYVGNLPPMPGVLLDYPLRSVPKHKLASHSKVLAGHSGDQQFYEDAALANSQRGVRSQAPTAKS